MNVFNQIKEVLSNRDIKPIDNSKSHHVHAAVLIPIFSESNSYKILFTQRTNTVEHHKGQISFPGGSVEDQDDNYLETALRESCEEIGVRQKDVEVLGRIDDKLTMLSHFIVHPFVGRIPYPYSFKINPHEVKKIITVPIHIFFSEEAYQIREVPDFVDPSYHGPIYEYQDNIIWGATARIMENLVRILKSSLGLPQDWE